MRCPLRWSCNLQKSKNALDFCFPSPQALWDVICVFCNLLGDTESETRRLRIHVRRRNLEGLFLVFCTLGQNLLGFFPFESVDFKSRVFVCRLENCEVVHACIWTNTAPATSDRCSRTLSHFVPTNPYRYMREVQCNHWTCQIQRSTYTHMTH